MKTYFFSVKDFTNANAYAVYGTAEGAETIMVTQFYYDFGVNKEEIKKAAEEWCNVLNALKLKVKAK